MSVLPKEQLTTATAILRQYEQVAESGRRGHLGASEIGHECNRYLWLSFRWAKNPTFDGRILRLFESGNREEPRLIANLRAIGADVHDRDENGAQFSFKDIGGHFSGSMDGAAKGLPEAPDVWHVLEFKTSNAKSFAALEKHGVEKSKPQQFKQMQMYMGWSGMEWAMYIVVNKDTDAIYSERVALQPAKFNQLLAKAQRIISDVEPPIGISENSSKVPCVWCTFKDQCHGTEAPQVNCRTCAHSTPELDGDARWSCQVHKKDLDIATQRASCADHRHIPVLLGRFAELMDANENHVLTYRNKLTNVEFQQPAYSSAEITACEHKQMLGEKVVDAFKREFGASVFDGMADDLPWATVEDIQPVAKPKKGKK
jgi:hypothetical protein